MDEVNLMLETGKDALDELSPEEKIAILGKYSNGQEPLAAMHVFKLLMRKYRPTYRMGRMYEALSDKYERYADLYNHYARVVAAGRLGHAPDPDVPRVEREKWPSQTDK